MQHAGSQFLDHGLNLDPQQWKRQVPTTGQVGKSLLLVLKVKRENQTKPNPNTFNQEASLQGPEPMTR